MFGFGKKDKGSVCPNCNSHSIKTIGATSNTSSGKPETKYFCENCGKEFTR